MNDTSAQRAKQRKATTENGRGGARLGLAFGAMLFACAGGIALLVSGSQVNTSSAQARAGGGALTGVEQARSARASLEAREGAQYDEGVQPGEDNQPGEPGRSSEGAQLANGVYRDERGESDAPSAETEALPALKQRLRGVALQLENRERSQALVDEALAGDDLSAEERVALEARNDKMITKLAAYHRQVAQLQGRIQALEVSR